MESVMIPMQSMNDDFIARVDTPPTPDAIYKMSKEEAVDLGAGLLLDADAKLAAYMDAMHIPAAEIEARCGRPAGSLLKLRMNAAYQQMVARCVRWYAERQARLAAIEEDIDGFYDGQVAPSAITLMEIRDNPLNKAKDRAAAAVDFLNRAPKAPKATTNREERRTVITIPVSELRNMQRALIEEGSDEDVEIASLIEGEDYEQTILGE